MRRVSIITPWKEHVELIPDYEAAVGGAEVILVDNASTPAVAVQLRGMTERLGGVYLRNQVNAGFAPANNQGLARATGEVIIFLNNDIAGGPPFLEAIRRDVADGELTGPALQRQLVYGIWLPYLEGWCIAAPRSTWDKLGGWDAEVYPEPYWEDNDLCLRAVLAGLRLRQVAWPVHHKGGQTTGNLLRWGEAFERNRATFAGRVRPLFERQRRAAAEPSAVEGVNPHDPISGTTAGGFEGSRTDSLTLAQRHHQAGELAEAERLYRQVLLTDPTNAQVWYLLGAACRGLANEGEAVACLRQAVQWQPDHADAHNHLGVLLAQQGRLDEAEASFRRALGLRPESIEYRNNLGLALRHQRKMA